MGLAESTRAMLIGAVLRPLAIVVGATFALHRLARRIGDTPLDTGYPSAVGDAFNPSTGVREAVVETAQLAVPAAVIGLVFGVVGVALARARSAGRSRTGGAGLVAGTVLALAVPGLAWIPLDQALGGSAGDDGLPVGETIRWAVLVALAIAPAVAVAVTGSRWWAAGPGGTFEPDHEATATKARRRLRLGLPLLAFGLALATAEVLSANGGLVDRFIGDLADDRPDELVALALPIVVAVAVLTVLADMIAWWGRRRPPLRPLTGPASVAATHRSRSPLVATVLGLGLVALIVVVSALTGASAADTPLRGPSFGGPWLGTDVDGRSLAARAGDALGLTLAASALPALVATAVGSGLAAFRRALGRTGRELLGALLDLLSWPPILIVPLAAWGVAPTARPSLHPIVLQVTGLLLVPKAARLLAPVAQGWRARLSAHAAAAGLLTAVAFAIHLLTGFVTPAGTATTPTLGRMMADGLGRYDDSPWPVLAPLLAAVVTAAALYWLVATLAATRPVSVPEAAPTAIDEDLHLDPQASTPADDPLDAEDDGGSDSPTEPGVEDGDDPPIGDAGDEDEGDDGRAIEGEGDPSPGPGPEDDPDTDTDFETDTSIEIDTETETDIDEVGAGGDDRPGDRPTITFLDEHPEAAPVERRTVEPPGPRIVLATEPFAPADDEADGPDEHDPDEDPSDIRDDITVASAVDVPPPEGEGDPDTPTIEDDASRTIELRPSDLRRAGLQPPAED